MTMAEAYKRLLDWAAKTDHTPDVTSTGTGSYSITVAIEDPVTFRAFAAAETIEETAVQVIQQLETVSGRALEEIP